MQLPEKHKIHFASHSDRGLRRLENNDSVGKFPFEHSNLSTLKGQLFIVADAKSGNPHGRDAGKMAMRLIQENFFSYPSGDINFCIQRAFDIANRQIYQYAQANGLHRKIGATCSALVLTEKWAYIAHVGDCRIYRISIRKIEQLTQDHTRIIEMMPRENGQPHTNGRARRPLLTRALGIKLGVKVDTVAKFPVHRDEYFLLCTDGMKGVPEEEIKNIVLSSSPQRACKKLIDMAREKGGKDDTSVQVIKVYNHYHDHPIETYSHVTELSTRWSNWPIYFMLVLLLVMIGFLLHEPALDKVNELIYGPQAKYAHSRTADDADLTPEEIERIQLNEAKEFMERRRWDDALKIYQTILRNNFEHPQALAGVAAVADAYKQRGDRAFHENNWGGALLYYNKSAKLQSDNRGLHDLIAECRENLKQQKLAEAREKLTDRIELVSHRATPSYSQNLNWDMAVHGIYSPHWRVSGLDENDDYYFHNKSVTFFDNIRIKKAFHRGSYGDVEVEAKATVLTGAWKSKYGIIFGHNLAAEHRYKDFYLFSMDRDGEFALHRITESKVRILVSEHIKPGIIGNYDAIHLKVKSFGKLILLYANGELLKMVPVDEAVNGGVGLYADPKLRVEFSHFKISPATQN